MALINCPSCGKKVSSAADTCVHCGAVLGSVGSCGASRDYRTLDTAEVEMLRDEFNALYPDYNAYRAGVQYNFAEITKYEKVLSIMRYVGGIAFWLPAVCIVYFRSLFYALFLLISVVGYAGLVILSVVHWFKAPRLRKTNIRNEAIMKKKYKTWLKECKNIEYNITGIEREYLDAYNDLELEDIHNLDIRRFK